MINKIIANTDFFTKIKLAIPIISTFLMVIFGLFVISQADFISHHQGLLRFIRWNFLLTCLLFWPEWAVHIGAALDADSERIVRWRSEVYRFATWMIIVDLLLAENLLEKLINLIFLK